MLSPADDTAEVLRLLGVRSEGRLESRSPIDGSVIGSVAECTDPEAVCAHAQKAFLQWRTVPAPRRGEKLAAGAGAA